LDEIRAQLCFFEETMSPYMRLHMLFSQISTTHFVSFIKNENKELDQLPSNPARDFFLRQICFDKYFEGIDKSA